MLSHEDELRELRYREYRYVHEARRVFRNIQDRELWDIDFPKGSALQYAKDCFEEAKLFRIMSGCWDEFFGFLNHSYSFSVYGSTSYYAKIRYSYSYLYNRNPHLAFREGLRYRRQPHHGKKAKDPNADWRRQLKGRSERRPNYRRHEKAGRWNKQHNHRKNRRAARQAIYDGRWTEFTQHVQDIQRVWWD